MKTGDKEYIPERKKVTKGPTEKVCLVHCRDECKTYDIVKFSEICWKVSVKMNVYLVCLC